jgi:hypothetical protein
VRKGPFWGKGVLGGFPPRRGPGDPGDLLRNIFFGVILTDGAGGVFGRFQDIAIEKAYIIEKIMLFTSAARSPPGTPPPPGGLPGAPGAPRAPPAPGPQKPPFLTLFGLFAKTLILTFFIKIPLINLIKFIKPFLKSYRKKFPLPSLEK